MFEQFAMFTAAMLVSAFGTVVGFGGGVFMVPILVLFFHVPIHFAVGSVILALFPAAVISTVHNVRRARVDLVVGILLEIPTIAGTVLGAWLTRYLPTLQLALLFSGMVTFTGFTMLRQEHGNTSAKFSLLKSLNRLPPRLERKTANGSYTIGGLTTLMFGSLSGMIAGLFGIGGGFIKGPLMVLGFGMPARVAAPTALFMIMITSLVGSVSHYFLGHLQLENGIFLTAGFTLGSILGNLRSANIAEKKLFQWIAWGLILAGLVMAIFTVTGPAR